MRRTIEGTQERREEKVVKCVKSTALCNNSGRRFERLK